MTPKSKFNNFFSKHFPKLVFFQSILSRKNWRGGGGLLFKIGIGGAGGEF